MNEVLKKLEHGLIVSCQALDGNPLKGSVHMAAMALAAQLGGAVGVRANGPEDIGAIRALVSIPIIGIYKTARSLTVPYITPDFRHAESAARSGADIIALDATARPRPGGEGPDVLIRRIKEELGVPVMADVSTFEEGVAAEAYGADLVATTLSGYTSYSPLCDGPDIGLITRLSRAVKIPVIAEGRITSPEEAAAAVEAGAYAIVVGKAITNVQFSTERFVRKAALACGEGARKK